MSTQGKRLMVYQEGFDGIVVAFDGTMEEVEGEVGVMVVDEEEGAEASRRVGGIII